MKILFTPKNNNELQQLLDSLPIDELVNSAGWPLANDHNVELIVDDKVIATFDGRVSSTDRRFQSIQRQSYKGKFGVHFTKSFKDHESPFAPISGGVGNHIAISLSDLDNDFVILERACIFNIKNVSIKIYDQRGKIDLLVKQENNKLSKFDVEIHKGNRYYASRVLSKGCPTIDHTQFDRFLATIFSSLHFVDIQSDIQSEVFDVEIAALPDRGVYSEFLNLQQSLVTAKHGG